MKARREPFAIGGRRVPAGERETVDLPLPALYTHTPLTMPVHVAHGRRDGPRLFLCAALHGDELNGVEIVRRVARRVDPGRLRGTLVAAPIVNVYGVIHHSRYLPDRRDLNRSFPGSERGSLAARLADLFMTEIVARCTHGIDLHTGAIHRSNLPQIRADLDDPATLDLARRFGVPVLLNAQLRDGSLRMAAAEHGVSMLLYEAGEALRFDEVSIRAGVRGVLRVMRGLGMLPATRARRAPPEPFIARSSVWQRAPASGIFRAVTPLGAKVERGQGLGVVTDPFGETEVEVRSNAAGIVIGRSNLPLVHEGEALFHVGRFESVEEAAERVEDFQEAIARAIEADPDPGIV